MSSTTTSDEWFTITDGMTALFTPAPSCSSKWTYEPQSWNSVSGGILLQNAIYESATKNADCYPSGYNQWGRAPSFAQIFSPGACPFGYATVGNLDGQGGKATTAICCPSHFGYTNAVGPVLGSNTTASYWGCTSTYPRDAGPTTVFAVTSGFTSRYNGEETSFTAVSGPILMWAQVVSVAYDSRDLSLFSSGSVTSTPMTSPASTRSTSTTGTTTSTPATSQAQLQSSESSLGLSSGATAGTVIGSIAVVGMLVGLAYFLWLKRRRDKSHQSRYPDATADPAVPTNVAQPQMYQGTKYEVDGNNSKYEVDAKDGAYSQDKDGARQGHFGWNELDGRNDHRYELGD